MAKSAEKVRIYSGLAPRKALLQRTIFLTVAYDKVGDMLRRQGKLADALATYNAAFAIRDRLAKADPSAKRFASTGGRFILCLRNKSPPE